MFPATIGSPQPPMTRSDTTGTSVPGVSAAGTPARVRGTRSKNRRTRRGRPRGRRCARRSRSDQRPQRNVGVFDWAPASELTAAAGTGPHRLRGCRGRAGGFRPPRPAPRRGGGRVVADGTLGTRSEHPAPRRSAHRTAPCRQAAADALLLGEFWIRLGRPRRLPGSFRFLHFFVPGTGLLRRAAGKFPEDPYSKRAVRYAGCHGSGFQRKLGDQFLLVNDGDHLAEAVRCQGLVPLQLIAAEKDIGGEERK